MPAVPRRENGRSPRRRVAVAALVVAGLVAVAFAPSWNGDVAPRAPTTGSAAAGATPETAPVATGPADAVRSGPAAPVTEGARSVVRPAHRIEVRDAAGDPVREVLVSLRAGANWLVETTRTGNDGNVDLDTEMSIDQAVDWSVEAAIAGRAVTKTLDLASPSNTTRIDMGPVGTLRVTWNDQFATAGSVQVVKDREGRGFHHAMGVAGGDVHVAADGDRCVVFAKTQVAEARTEVIGPRFQGDIVDVRFDLRRCRVVGRLVGPNATSGEPTWLRWTTATQQDAFALGVGDDGAISFPVAVGEPATIVIHRQTECAVVSLPRIDADPYDIGTILLEPRPVLGTVQVRDPDGTIALDSPHVVAMLGIDGNPIDPARMAALVFCRPILGRGIEVLGSPGVASVTLDLDTAGHVCEPATLVVRGGGAFAATRVRGGRVVLTIGGPPSAGLYTVRLREVSTGREYPSGGSRSIDGVQYAEFEGLRAGRYVAFATDAQVIGETIAVQTDTTQEVHVTVQRW